MEWYLTRPSAFWTGRLLGLSALLLIGGCSGGGGSHGPTAAFSATPTAGSGPLTVAFTDKSSGTITSYSWNFGDDGMSGEKNPVYTYSEDGCYTVSLTVSDGKSSNKKVREDFIVVGDPPQANFSASPMSGPATLRVQFTDLSEGKISNWSWSFGDGMPSSPERSPKHSYVKDGTYTVSLRVSGPLGTDELVRERMIEVGRSTGRVAIERTEIDLPVDMSHPQVLVAEDGSHWVACQRGESNTVLLSYDHDGKLQWQKEFAPEFSVSPGKYRFVRAPDGGLWMLGDPDQSPDLKLSAAKVSSDGDLEWQNSFGVLLFGEWQDLPLPDAPPASRIRYHGLEFGEIDLEGHVVRSWETSTLTWLKDEVDLQGGELLLIGPEGSFVAHLRSDRSVLWENVVVGSSGSATLEQALECRDGGTLLIGGEQNGLWLAKLDRIGSLITLKTLEPSFNQGTEIQGLAGDRMSGYYLLLKGLGGGWVVRTDPDGTFLWDAEVEAPAETMPLGIVERPEGGCLLFGETSQEQPTGEKAGWLLALEPDGKVAWEKLLLGFSAIDQVFLTDDGDYLLSGSKAPNELDRDASIAKLDDDGSIAWQRTWTRTRTLDFLRLSDGRFAFAGVRQNGPQILVLAELDPSGTIRWNRELPSTALPEGDRDLSIAPLGGEGLLIASIAIDLRSFERNLVLVRTARGQTGGTGCDGESTFSDAASVAGGHSRSKRSVERATSPELFPTSALVEGGREELASIQDFDVSAVERMRCGP